MLSYKRRISKSTDWQRIHKKGLTVHSKDIVLKTTKNNLPYSRFGFIVGIKIDKKATKRNQIKRRLRAIISEKLKNIEGGNDIIFIAKPSLTTKTYKELKEIIVILFKRSRLFK